MFYELTIQELELFIKSIQISEYLMEIQILDNGFELDDVKEILLKYQLSNMLLKFNNFSQYNGDKEKEEEDNDDDDEQGEEEESKKENKRSKKNMEVNFYQEFWKLIN